MKSHTEGVKILIWIILALTLGASITSIMHGGFLLLDSLGPLTGAIIPGIPQKTLALLPIISAIFALIGGIIAFNQSKWGALFLFIAMGLCIPAGESTWIYGGLYFFAGIFCFFLKPKAQSDYPDLYDDDDQDAGLTDDTTQDFYYMNEAEPISEPAMPQSVRPLGEDISVVSPQSNNEPPKLRRRMSKSCPECGAVVARDAFYCPTCGAKLFVVPNEAESTPPQAAVVAHEPNDEVEIGEVNEQLFTPSGSYVSEEILEDNNLNMNDGDEMASTQTAQSYRTSSARRSSHSNTTANEAATSYTEYATRFSRSKKRKRSPMKKILSMTLIVGGVGLALYFLLGLRKLPPDKLPPMQKPEVVEEPAPTPIKTVPVPATNDDNTPPVAVVAVNENELPNFIPDLTPTTGVVIGSNVNVRADHTTNSSRVTRLNVGTRVDVIDTYNVTSGQYAGIWYNIRTGGREGWVYGRYLQPVGNGLPSGYTNALLKTFGSSRSELVDALGNPTKSTSSTADWSGLTVTLSGTEITRLRVTGSSRTLQNGLKPGMRLSDVQKIMGYPSSVKGSTHTYNEGGKAGVTIQFDKNNAASVITVSEV